MDFWFAPRACGGDEAAALGGVGLLLEHGNQHPLRELVRNQRRAPDGGPEPLLGSVDRIRTHNAGEPTPGARPRAIATIGGTTVSAAPARRTPSGVRTLLFC